MTGVPNPETISTKQQRIAELAGTIRSNPLHSLSKHIDLEWMYEAYRRTRKNGAAGVDGETAAEFEQELEQRLHDLLSRSKSGRYRAPPVKRVHIPKDGGRTRPIGIPTFEDKVLQRAVSMVLEPVYEREFYDFSYGFRPGRSAHDALEALQHRLWKMGGGVVLEVDISSFFDTLDHQQLRDILRQRVTDGVVVRLVGKWLNAGVLDGGVMTRPEAGTPQGGVISPLLANIYLHEVLDRWWMEQASPRLRGEAHLVRYADDFVIVFSDESDARRVQKVLPERFARFGLTLNREKTRLVRFRRPPRNKKRRELDDDDRPGSFDFLGFTHYWGTSRKGKWIPKRKTARKRFSRAVRRANEWCRRHRHQPVAQQAEQLGHKLRGHYNYFGITGNSRALVRFYEVVRRLWMKWLGRRSQRGYLRSDEFVDLIRRHPLPLPRAPRSALAGTAKP